MVRAAILIKAPKSLVASKVRGLEGVKEAFDVRGRFDAVALVEVASLSDLKRVAFAIHGIEGVRRTETLVEVG